jgi:hypothetical protein
LKGICDEFQRIQLQDREINFSSPKVDILEGTVGSNDLDWYAVLRYSVNVPRDLVGPSGVPAAIAAPSLACVNTTLARTAQSSCHPRRFVTLVSINGTESFAPLQRSLIMALIPLLERSTEDQANCGPDASASGRVEIPSSQRCR